MPVKNYKPTSPGIRFQSHHTFDELTKTKPEKSLTTLDVSADVMARAVAFESRLFEQIAKYGLRSDTESE